MYFLVVMVEPKLDEVVFWDLDYQSQNLWQIEAA
jgi:hypothetical protein